MTTAWTLPSVVDQYPESGGETAHISWNELDNFSALKDINNRSVQSNGALIHVARSPKLDIRNKTYFLRATGFNFQNLPDTLTGIAVRLTARRYGRATDDTIQLCLNGEMIGENYATLLITPQKVYGGSEDLWNTSLTIDDIRDPSFGFTLRFQAHRDWPHKDPVLVDAVEIQIY